MLHQYSVSSYSNEDCKKKLLEILGSVKRDGMDAVVKYLTKQSDFMTAPASTKYHESRESGLLRHSLNVYGELMILYAAAVKENKVPYDEGVKDSIAIVALLHDICKANYYEVGSKNVKQLAANGKEEWVKVPFYKTKDDATYYAVGNDHGYDSVIKLQQLGLKLNKDELSAIAFHMGNFENKATGKAYERSPLALLLHVADLMATYIDEIPDPDEEAEA